MGRVQVGAAGREEQSGSRHWWEPGGKVELMDMRMQIVFISASWALPNCAEVNSAAHAKWQEDDKRRLKRGRGWVGDGPGLKHRFVLGEYRRLGPGGRDQYRPMNRPEVRQAQELPDKFPISAAAEEEEGGGCRPIGSSGRSADDPPGRHQLNPPFIPLSSSFNRWVQHQPLSSKSNRPQNVKYMFIFLYYICLMLILLY